MKSSGLKKYLHDYGEIPEDGDGSWSFAFKNLGKEPIVINRVRSTCGCTVPAWPREPIEPGASGEITVKYNTATAGTFFKSLYVYSSAANSPVKLQIKGKVIPIRRITACQEFQEKENMMPASPIRRLVPFAEEAKKKGQKSIPPQYRSARHQNP